MTVPEGDNRERHVCIKCGEIQYQNPKIVAGCIISWQEKLLLCKRAIDPRKGYWTIPAGFLENGESIEQGAVRETREEARAEVTGLHLYQIYSMTQIDQIYMLYRGHLCDPQGFSPGIESLEVRLVDEQEIPWNEIAFAVVGLTLKRYLKERQKGIFTFCIDVL